jgi:transcription elongation factor GreA
LEEHPVATTTWLTPEAFERLKAEYAHLSGDARTEIVARISQAREEGDLKENGGYHAAKEEQGKAEARIRQLREILENAQVGEPPAGADDVVSPGVVVTITLAGDEMRFLVGSREAAAGSDIDVYSEKSPLGAAILGHKVGDAVSYTAPNGKVFEVKILDTKAFTG